MPTHTERRERIEKIRALPDQLEALVSQLTPAQLTARALEEEWTVAQIVHHLADSHLNSFIRLKLILTEDRPTLKPYNQERWAETVDANNVALPDSLALLHGLHRRWVTLLESLVEADWGRPGLHPEIGEITIDDLLRIYANHGEAHLEQIKRVLAAQS